MILRLAVHDFGKFQGRRFELAPVTVVYGPNEAGKTTFFDALIHALCRPSETKLLGKAMKKRYGPGRKAEAETDPGAPFDMGEDEFLGLCAIRAGDLSLDLAKDSPWIAKLKAGLFHGGLDPAELAAEFGRRGSDWRTYLHSKELAALREEADEARKELAAARGERDGLLARERGLAGEEASLEETRRLRDAARAASREAQAALAFEERIDRRRRTDEALAALDRRTELEARLAELAAYREDRRGEWEALSEAARTAAGSAQADGARRDLLAAQAAKARAALRLLDEESAYHAGRSRLAAELAAELRASSAGSSEAGAAAAAARWRLWAAWLPALAGVALAFTASGTSRAAALLAGLALSAAAFAFLRSRARRRSSIAVAEAGRNALARAKDRFALGELDLAARHGNRENSGARPVLADISTLEGLLEALDRLAAEGVVWEGRLLAARRQAAEGEEAAEAAGRAAAESREREAACRRAEREWLDRQGVPTAEEYLARVRRHADLSAELARRPGTEASASEADRRDLLRLLKDLDEEGVPRQGRDEAARQRLRQQARDAEAAREELGREADARASALALEAGQVRGMLGRLAGEIVRAEERLMDLEARIADKELDKRAAAVAEAIFKDIGEGADLLLAGLAKEFEAMVSHILPEDRDVVLSGLDRKHIQVDDAGGGRRPLESLSTGTRDAVVLAARLALALKARGDAGLLVLDEPFLAMDRQREERALKMLERFHLLHGWQIILLTKDPGLRDAMSRVFPGLKVLDLGS